MRVPVEIHHRRDSNLPPGNGQENCGRREQTRCARPAHVANLPQPAVFDPGESRLYLRPPRLPPPAGREPPPPDDRPALPPAGGRLPPLNPPLLERGLLE
jgi:hypothetical protein